MPMPTWGEPYLVMHLIWHPRSRRSTAVARRLSHHFARDRFPVEEPLGLTVFEWSSPTDGSTTPPQPIFRDGVVHAVFVLVDDVIEADHAWTEYVTDLAARCTAPTNGGVPQQRRLFPVAMNPTSAGALATSFGAQALRWHSWSGNDRARASRLIREVTYASARLLRAVADDEFGLTGQMQKVRVFLSHSKHDRAGPRVADAIRSWLSNDVQLDAFLDLVDVPAGLPSDQVLEEGVRQSAFLAIHTDSFSSREWCRREVLLAKKTRRPMVVVDCIAQVDERAYPYLGNVPLVRLNPTRPTRLEPVVQRLLDEIFKDFLWQCRTDSFARSNPDIAFVPSPPELATLATATRLHPSLSRIVYPDPPIGFRESDLLAGFGTPVQSLGEWLTGVAP